MDQHDDRARPQTRTLRGTCITRTVDLANPRLIGVWKWNFEEASRRLYAVCVYAPNVLREAYPLEELQGLRDCFAEQISKVEKMIDWTRAQLDAASLQSGEPGRVEPLSADIRTPWRTLTQTSSFAPISPSACWTPCGCRASSPTPAMPSGQGRCAVPHSVPWGRSSGRMRGAGRALMRCIDSGSRRS